MNRLINKISKNNQLGFTILEILIAVIIIGVLVAVAISRYTQRTDDAKNTTARSEMQQLVKAEQAVELDTEYYVSLRVLNDIHGGPTPIMNNSMGWWEYPIELEPGLAIDTSGAYAAKNNVDLAGDWQGPYMQFKQQGPRSNLLGVYTNDELPETNSETKYGIPLDPWGSPYRFYGPYYSNAFNAGAINPDSVLTPGFLFDRFAIVSFGKNTTRDFDKGLPGSGNIGDDIIIYF
jgi:prepilin-type N-terminal cleavage/methylation domain-containing protein